VQHLGQAEPIQALGQLLLRVGIGEEVLHTLEVGLRRGLEAVEEIDFVIKHGQVGAELGVAAAAP
jgi:hypothetical protein